MEAAVIPQAGQAVAQRGGAQALDLTPVYVGEPPPQAHHPQHGKRHRGSQCAVMTATTLRRALARRDAVVLVAAVAVYAATSCWTSPRIPSIGTLTACFSIPTTSVARAPSTAPRRRSIPAPTRAASPARSTAADRAAGSRGATRRDAIAAFRRPRAVSSARAVPVPAPARTWSPRPERPRALPTRGRTGPPALLRRASAARLAPRRRSLTTRSPTGTPSPQWCRPRRRRRKLAGAPGRHGRLDRSISGRNSRY